MKKSLLNLGACAAEGVEVDSEKRPQRGQFSPDLQAHSLAMGQKAGEKWTAVAASQPTLLLPRRLMRNKTFRNAKRSPNTAFLSERRVPAGRLGCS